MKTRIASFGNGSKGGIFFNGKHDKQVRKAIRKGEMTAPVYNPPERRYNMPTSRYIHKPWPFKRKQES